MEVIVKIIFRSFVTTMENGEKIESSMPILFNTAFYLKCLNMPKKKPISYDEAANMCCNFVDVLISSGNTEAANKFILDNWADYLSEQGYHVEFEIDDFELSQNAAA